VRTKLSAMWRLTDNVTVTESAAVTGPLLVPLGVADAETARFIVPSSKLAWVEAKVTLQDDVMSGRSALSSGVQLSPPEAETVMLLSVALPLLRTVAVHDSSLPAAA